jgi:predicted HTH domain antitoxin
MPVITARVPEDLIKDLERIEREEHSDRAEVIRKLVAKAVREWKLQKALDMLKGHKVSYRRAAKMAGVTYVEMLGCAAEAGMDIGYSLEDLRKDAGK